MGSHSTRHSTAIESLVLYSTLGGQWTYVHASLDVDDVERRIGPAGDPNGVRARHEAEARDRLREQVQRLQQLALEAPQPQLLVEAARHDPVQFIQVRNDTC